MASITVRHVPDSVRDELASRAAREGKSLQEYLRGQLIELAGQPRVEDVIARIRERKRITGTHIPTSEILEMRDADRT